MLGSTSCSSVNVTSSQGSGAPAHPIFWATKVVLIANRGRAKKSPDLLIVTIVREGIFVVPFGYYYERAAHAIGKRKGENAT